MICEKINIYGLKTRLNVGDEIDFLIYLEISKSFYRNVGENRYEMNFLGVQKLDII